MGPQQLQVARLCEYYFIDCLELPASDQRIADVARHGLSVGHRERLVLLAHGDAHVAQRIGRNPRHL
jgi:hypothetical protein